MTQEQRDFVTHTLYPALFGNIDRAFPELHFTRRGSHWESNHHLDGSRNGGGKVCTYVYENRPYCAIEHGKEAVNLVNLYMGLHSLPLRDSKAYYSALTALAEICGLSLPEDSEEWREYEAKQRNRDEAHSIFVAALWGDTEEAKRTRDYLHSRKWSDEEIKQAELGLITSEVKSALPQEAKALLRNSEGREMQSLGTTHLLYIPCKSLGRCLGFKFRAISPDVEPRYIYTSGSEKSRAFSGLKYGTEDVIIVEGELDALHAQVRGAGKVVATNGGGASAEQIQDAIKRGANTFTLLYDNDEAGRKYNRPTIETIHKVGGDVDIYVASLPEGYKDTDEYLAEHSVEEFDAVVRAALPYYTYVLKYLIEDKHGLPRKHERGEVSIKDREAFLRDVVRLLNSGYVKPHQRQDVFAVLQDWGKALNFSVDDFRAGADRDYYRSLEVKRTEETKAASEAIARATASGRTDEALKIMRETYQKQSATEKTVDFARVFAPPSPQEYYRLLSEIKEGIPTGYKFAQGKHCEPLTLNSGLTFICGYRGHGKTSFLNNIALNEARRNVALGNGKSVLYFSYEVDRRRLMVDLLNTFVNDPNISQNPRESIQSFFRGAGDKFFRNERRADGLRHYDYFLQKQEQFLRDYISSGALTIVEENYKVETLLDAIRSYLSYKQVSIVCIDYAQLIYSEDYSRQRTEEIKRVVNDIKDFANRQGIPFVLAAQFNRDVDSPVSVDTRNIGEGGDFERIADTCVGLYNLKELHPLPRNKEEEKSAKKLLQDLGVATYSATDELRPIEGKLFVRLLKRRYGYYPLDVVLPWEGRTKYIEPNAPEALSTAPTQQALPFRGDDNDEEASPF